MSDTTWTVAPGGPWQARLCPKGRAHVIGLQVAGLDQNHDHRDGKYLRRRWLLGRVRPWHPGPAGFDRACRVAWSTMSSWARGCSIRSSP